jgi:hypothetical protein
MSTAFTRVSFYIVAHADDWQLFMQPNAYNDLILPDNKVVFIVTTAGDAGLGDKYWKAREEGMKSSVRFCLAPFRQLHESSSVNCFNGHSIYSYSINNTTSYFFRLPDGGLDGKGFSENDYNSLSQFKSGDIHSIAAIDKSATYSSWSDLSTTIEKIIELEGDGAGKASINYQNPDRTANPKDHPDHIATGHAVKEMRIISALNQLLFTGYSIHENKQKLCSKDLFWKAGMFAAYEQKVFDLCGYSTLAEGVDIYLKWCKKAPQFSTVDTFQTEPAKEHPNEPKSNPLHRDER